MSQVRVLHLLAFSGIIVSVVSVAPAVLVQHNGVTIFKDDFEAGTIGARPDNGALPGTWGLVGADDANAGAGRVTDAASPGPFQGAKYLHRGRNAPGINTYQGGAKFDTPVTSGTLHAEWMTYVPAGAEWFSFVFSSIPTNASDLVANSRVYTLGFADGINTKNSTVTNKTWGISATGPIGSTNPPESGNYDPGLHFVTNQWQKYEIDYTFETNTFTMTLDGVTAGPFFGNDPANLGPIGTSATDTSGQIDGFYFWFEDNDNEIYVDAAPIPGDFNDDSVVDAADIDMLCEAIRNGGPTNPYDVDGNPGVEWVT